MTHDEPRRNDRETRQRLHAIAPTPVEEDGAVGEDVTDQLGTVAVRITIESARKTRAAIPAAVRYATPYTPTLRQLCPIRFELQRRVTRNSGSIVRRLMSRIPGAAEATTRFCLVRQPSEERSEPKYQ